MSSKKEQNKDLEQEPLSEEQIQEEISADAETAESEGAAEPTLEEQLESAKAELEKEKKEYMFLAAEFDNFRKRVIKEKAELIKNAGEQVFKGLLPILDDFERGIKAAKAGENVDAVLEGMELIYNKFKKYLEQNGVKEMDMSEGVFNTDLHEAISAIPVTDESLKGKILDTVQTGYMINDKVLRHAKVVVGK
jgi:molecular chaperone GrpE